MTQRPIDTNSGLAGSQRSVLNTIREDMEVYDIEEKHVGEVEDIFLGTTNQTAIENGEAPATADSMDLRDDSIVDIVARAFADDDLPEVLQKRLLYYGFIKVDGEGLLAPDRYIMADQISGVRGDKVYLKVKRDELIKR